MSSAEQGGRRIGDRYLLLGVAGEGGLGRVWRAHDEMLDRTVAVKELIFPAATTEAERRVLLARTVREARAAARLTHPNIVTVHDVVIEDGRPWIVMKFLEGRSLWDLIHAEERLDERVVATIASQLLDAIQAAHEAGIVHRDIKPSNVIITRSAAVLTDFGIAKVEGDSSLTQQGLAVGTPGFLPPERIMGERATPASDLWALGATLYAAIEGHPPFERADALSTVSATLAEPVPQAPHARHLASLLGSLLEREQDRRPTAAQARALALRAQADAVAAVYGAGADDSEPPQADFFLRRFPNLIPHTDEAPPRAHEAREQEEPESTTDRVPPVVMPHPAERPRGEQAGRDQTGVNVPLPRPIPSPTPPPFGPQVRPDGRTQGVPVFPPTPAQPQGERRLPGSRRLSPTRRRRRRRPDRPVSPTDFIQQHGDFEPYEPYEPYEDAADLRPQAALYAPLRESFRYVHEPLTGDDDAIPLLGNERLIKSLKERLVNSRGGTFLVAGFRGVGKSTLIERALCEIDDVHPRGRRVLPVVLSVARPMATDRLLFAIVRRVFEELTERGVLDSLPPDIRQSLVIAYMRTSLAFKETRADAVERTTNVELDPSRVGRGLLRPAGLVIPKAGLSTKRSRSMATEAAFLAYSETDVEHDMMRIIRLLSAALPPRRPPWWRRLLRLHPRPLDLQLVVVLDEVDKLTALKKGMNEVERLLGGIKNVVTMRGAHYLVVAGPDLHDRVLRDSGRGNSIYESIFAWRLYVPCSWDAPKRLLAELCGVPGGGVIEEFEQYLRFKSRGVLRRLLHELNSFVVWEEPLRPYLRIGPHEQETIAFYAELERALDAFFTSTARQVLPSPIEQDRWRLSAYYVTDWVLRSEGRPFTSADVVQAERDGEFEPLLRITATGAERLLAHLAERGMLETVRQPAHASTTMVQDVAGSQQPSYRLTPELMERLLRIAVHSEDERAELDRSGAPTAEEVSRSGVPVQVIGDRYELRRLIGEGATSSVYEGHDTLLRRPVAVKLLRTSLQEDAQGHARFVREARIAAGVHHPNVVDVYEVVSYKLDRRSQLAIVMELIDAPTLAQTLEKSGPLPPVQAVRAGTTLAGAVGYLADNGLCRLDLKPENIVMARPRGPVIIDLGIARIAKDAQTWLLDGADDDRPAGEPVTQLGRVVGTPNYMPPEQIRGEDVDIRADIYALGRVLHTALLGRHPYEGLPGVTVMALTRDEDPDVSDLPCSEELRQVIAKATARDASARYETSNELRDALERTPEAAEAR